MNIIATRAARRDTTCLSPCRYLYSLFAVLNNVRRGIAIDLKVGGISAVRWDAENPRAGKWPRARGPGWAGPRGQGSPGGRKEPGKMFLPREILYLSTHNAQVGVCTHTRREWEGERKREYTRAMRSSSYTAMRTCNLRERKGPFCPLFFPPRFIGLCFTSPPPLENAIRCAVDAMWSSTHVQVYIYIICHI